MAHRETTDETLARLRAAQEAERRGALGGLRDAAGRHDADQERAVRLAADNLLDKALRRLADGDEAAALRLVERALRLETDGSRPGEDGALAVHLFVWDAIREVVLESDDDGWVEAVSAVADGLDPVARLEWADALVALEGDLGSDAPWVPRVRRIAGPVPERDPFQGVPAEARAPVVIALLRGVLAVTA